MRKKRGRDAPLFCLLPLRTIRWFVSMKFRGLNVAQSYVFHPFLPEIEKFNFPAIQSFNC